MSTACSSGCFVSLCGVLTTSCGYSLAGRGSFLPASIKTIGIPTFTNRTTVFNLETNLTEKVRAEFIGRGKFEIVPDSDRRGRAADRRSDVRHDRAGQLQRGSSWRRGTRSR